MSVLLYSLQSIPHISRKVWREDNPVLPDFDNGENLLLEYVCGDTAGEGLVDFAEVIEDGRKARLELLSEFPCVGNSCRGVVKNVADDMQPSNLSRNGCGVDEERADDDVDNLRW